MKHVKESCLGNKSDTNKQVCSHIVYAFLARIKP